jgi:hypothetical protein
VISTGSPSPHPYLPTQIAATSPQLPVGLVVEYACHRTDLVLSDPDRNLGIAPDILDPSGGFTHFGE